MIGSLFLDDIGRSENKKGRRKEDGGNNRIEILEEHPLTDLLIKIDKEIFLLLSPRMTDIDAPCGIPRWWGTIAF
jgi:hypothetical protein